MEELQNFINERDAIEREIANAFLKMSVHPDERERQNFASAKQESEKMLFDLINPENYERLKWNLLAVQKVALMFRDNGCNLPYIEQAQISKLNKQIKDLESRFTQNISNTKYFIDLPDASNSVLTPSLYNKILASEPDPDLRRAAVQSKENPIEENFTILREIFELRARKAHALGYKRVSDMKHSNMSVENCRSFLNELIEKIRPIVDRDVMKKVDVLGVSKTDLLKLHNRLYYNNLYIQKMHDVDLSDEVYDTQKVIEVFKDIYADLLQIDCMYTGNSGDKIWIDLPYLQVGEHRIYFDTTEREGKYPHASNWNYFDSDREHAYLTCCIGEKISYNSLVTLFHELGHAFNVVLNKVTHPGIGGTKVERDIVEVPSMYFEKYLQRPEVLAKLGIDSESANKIIAAANMFEPERILRNACLALIDIELNDGLLDVDDVPRRMAELTGCEYEVGNFVTRWVHQVGYECQYYSYVYSICWAAQVRSDGIAEYLRYSSDENLKRMFGPLDIDSFVSSFSF